jgi:hypothetical protein
LADSKVAYAAADIYAEGSEPTGLGLKIAIGYENLASECAHFLPRSEPVDVAFEFQQAPGYFMGKTPTLRAIGM